MNSGELKMVVARVVKYYFKKGKRENDFTEVDLAVNKRARSVRGFRGYISLFSYDEEDVATIITLWQDVESFKASEEVSNADVEKFMVFLERRPEVGYHRVDSIALI
jgi:heme-degrading monooxygenase HmoA